MNQESQIEQEDTVNVPYMTQQLVEQAGHMHKNVLAYSRLMGGTMPILSWVAHTDAGPVEMLSDTSLLPSEAAEAFTGQMAGIHSAGMLESLQALRGILNTLEQALTPQPPAPVSQQLASLPDGPVPNSLIPVQPAQVPQPVQVAQPVQPGQPLPPIVMASAPVPHLQAAPAPVGVPPIAAPIPPHAQPAPAAPANPQFIPPGGPHAGQ